MADPTIPTPQQNQLIQQQADSLLKVAEAAAKKAIAGKELNEVDKQTIISGKELLISQGKTNSVISQGAELVKKATVAIKSFAEELGFGKSSLDNIMDSLQGSTEKNQAFINSLAQAYTSIDIYRKSMTATSAAFHGFTGDASGSSLAMTAFSNSIKSTFESSKLLQAIPGAAKLAELSERFLSATAQARAFETSILQAATAGGSVESVLRMIGKEGQSLGENLDQTMTAVNERIYRLGINAGIGTKEAVEAVMETMKTLPNEIDKHYDFINEKTKNTTLTTEQLLFKLAAGTGTSFKEVAGVAASMAGTFGSSAEKASERIAVMAKASSDLKIPFGSLKKMTDELDNSFGLWGDQSEHTIGILTNVSKALQGSKIGFEGQIDIVKKVTSAIGGMSLGMRSFIGIQGGLRGGAVSAGLQIERMLQEGNMDKIAEMMQQTIEKRTGRGAVTLQEATENPQLTNVFMQQRALLSSMKIEGEATQNRVLEAMSKSNIGGATGISAKETLKEALSKGDSIQERQRNDTALIAQHTSHLITINSAIEAYGRERVGFGTTKQGTEIREETARRADAGTTETDVKALNKELVSQGASGLLEFAKQAGSFGKNEIKYLGSLSGEAIENMPGGDKILNATAAIGEKIGLVGKAKEGKPGTPVEAEGGKNTFERSLAALRGATSPLKLQEGESRPTLGTRGGGAAVKEASTTAEGKGSESKIDVYVHIIDGDGKEVGIQRSQGVVSSIVEKMRAKGQ